MLRSTGLKGHYAMLVEENRKDQQSTKISEIDIKEKK